ncbi:sigma-54 interaction domain-containing protein [Azonexus sp. IMCC34839]|uniref:sigma-54 interaction domain-containing protein n=1 Tax=Azonexus sp. IMCC34839 TaxID=3133695 RepID=UPI00399ACFCB
MANERWLVSWIGRTDLRSAEKNGADGLGPIASAFTSPKDFDRIYLLTNFGYEESFRYCEWLEKTTGCVETDLFEVGLRSPIDYADIYENVTAELKRACLPRDGVELTFHLSAGTPAMAAIWIILAKTRFPAKLIQTSKEHGLESVDFFFDLANEFLPEFLQRSGDRISRLSAAHEAVPGFEAVVHRSAVMAEQIALARKMAAFPVPVLILGETGTGKEVFAEAIHKASDRAGKQFLPVNCGAIPKDLANSELFGHKKGAFTGATDNRLGLFREAEGGTIFLDEIGDLPLDSQVRLLRALQEQEITPVGESRPVKTNVRIIAATHRNLQKDVATGLFREDLFHRLAVGVLNLPALRNRDGDIELLVDHFLAKVNADSAGMPEAQHKEISVGAKKLLFSYAWPGNIRELYHTILRAVIWSDGPVIEEADIERALLPTEGKTEGILDRPIGHGFELQALLDEVSKHYISKALEASSGKKKQAADMLGFDNYQTLRNWMIRYGMAG